MPRAIGHYTVSHLWIGGNREKTLSSHSRLFDSHLKHVTINCRPLTSETFVEPRLGDQFIKTTILSLIPRRILSLKFANDVNCLCGGRFVTGAVCRLPTDSADA